MPYTIGASHGPFTGRGNFVISKPAGIRTVVTSIPPFVGRDAGAPPRWFWLGRFTLGNIDGFSRSWGLEYAQQLVYPLPAIWELLSYDVRNGASCLFQELVDVPDLTLKQPWDRTPLAVVLGANTAATPGAGLVQHWTYTVPVGRRMMLSHSLVRLTRTAVATTLGGPQADVRVGGVEILKTLLFSNVIGSETIETFSGGPMILNAGTIITGNSNNSDTAGAVSVEVRSSGFLFDA